MKFLNKVALFLFSWVVLLLSIVLCGIIFGWIGMGQIEYVVNNLLYEKDVIDKNLYEQVSKRIDKLLFEENKKILLHH